MNRNTLILLVIILLLGLLYFFFIYKKDKTTLNATETDFAVVNPSSIEQIEMDRYTQGKKYMSLTLDKQSDSTWTLNNSLPANQKKVEGFLSFLKQIEVREPLPPQAVQNVVNMMKKEYTEIRIKDGSGTKTYFVGNNSPDGKGTFMQLAGAENIYITEVPGFEGGLRYRYSVEAEDWADNELFNIPQGEISTIMLEFKDKKENFTLNRNSPSAPWMLNGKSLKDTTALSYYLKRFKKVNAESYAAKAYPGMKDSLVKMIPDFRFTISGFSTPPRTIRLYVRSDTKSSFFGWIEGKNELLTIQDFVFGPFLVGKSYFTENLSGRKAN